jgi:hypothetical protein
MGRDHSGITTFASGSGQCIWLVSLAGGSPGGPPPRQGGTGPRSRTARPLTVVIAQTNYFTSIRWRDGLPFVIAWARRPGCSAGSTKRTTWSRCRDRVGAINSGMSQVSSESTRFLCTGVSSFRLQLLFSCSIRVTTSPGETPAAATKRRRANDLDRAGDSARAQARRIDDGPSTPLVVTQWDLGRTTVPRAGRRPREETVGMGE